LKASEFDLSPSIELQPTFSKAQDLLGNWVSGIRSFGNPDGVQAKRGYAREESRPRRRLAWAGSETMRGCRIGRRIGSRVARRSTMNARRWGRRSTMNANR
jgi:hypothetical protein